MATPSDLQIDALVDEVVFDQSMLRLRKGRGEAGPGLEVIRALAPGDLETLSDPELRPAEPAPLLATLRHAHHNLAQLLAQGMPLHQVCLLSGYTPAYVSNLQHDPSFAELLSGYRTQREQIFVDTVERMKTLGLSSLDELQARLTEDSASWTKRELMELADLCLVKGVTQATQPIYAPQGGTNIEIVFVQPRAQEPEGLGPVLEGELEE